MLTEEALERKTTRLQTTQEDARMKGKNRRKNKKREKNTYGKVTCASNIANNKEVTTKKMIENDYEEAIRRGVNQLVQEVVILAWLENIRTCDIHFNPI